MDAARVYRVGRDPDNDIVIEHGSVSRAHCELRVLDDGAVLLADLGSMNGTAVRQNGQWEHIEQATVERDERILLGEIVTTVAALLARAPKPSDRAGPAVGGKAGDKSISGSSFGGPDFGSPNFGGPKLGGPNLGGKDGVSPRPRRIPRPTLPARPEASGLIGRLIQSDWARLHRRSSERKPRRDEPSICLPAIVAVGGVDDNPDSRGRASLLREPSPRSRRPPTAPVAGFGAARLPAALDSPPAEGASAAADAPVNFAALAGAPMLAPPPDPMALPPRREPSLLAGPVSRRQMDDGPPPLGRWKRRWLPSPRSPAFAKWAVVGSALLLTSGGAVAAYLKYGPEAAPAATMAAAVPHRAAAAERAPGDTVPAPPPNPAETRKPLEKRADTAASVRGRTWQHSIEGTPESAIHAAAAARDGICLAGVTALAAGGQEAWVIRLDARGSVRWQRRPGGANRDAALAVTAASDGGCVAAGYDTDETRLWIFKIDSKGVLAWSRTVPAGHSGRAVAIQRLRDGGFAVAAHAKPAPDRPDRAFVLRLTPKGEIKWSKYAGHGESLPTDLRETADGGVVVAGMAREKGNARMALWAARLDRNGRTRWEEHYGGPGTPTGARIELARGSEFVIAASMTGIVPAAGEAAGMALRLLRIHDDGEVIWDRRHGNAARRVAGIALTRGGIYVAGDAGPRPAAPELWIAQFDANGRSVRESRVPAAAADRAAALAELADGRLVLVGTADIEGTARRGAGLIFLDRSGQLIAER